MLSAPEGDSQEVLDDSDMGTLLTLIGGNPCCVDGGDFGRFEYNDQYIDAHVETRLQGDTMTYNYKICDINGALLFEFESVATGPFNDTDGEKQFMGSTPQPVKEVGAYNLSWFKAFINGASKVDRMDAAA